MRKLSLYGATAVGIVIGAIAFHVTPAYADLPVIDPASIAEEIQTLAKESGILSVLQAVQSINQGISSAIGSTTFGSTNTLLQEGFTQNANYSKAQIGAQEQIADASNEAMGQYMLQLRDAQIRDQQTVSPTQCAALDGGVSTQSAAHQAYQVAYTIAKIQDERDQGWPTMPSYYGQAQGAAAANAEHINGYCDANDQAAGLPCAANTATADTDQSFSTLFAGGTYATQQALTAAKDYATNLIEAVAPAPLRGSQLTSLAGQDAQVARRAYNARISAAQTFLDNIVGEQSQTVPLTTVQQNYLTNMGLTAQTQGSWLQVLQIESERRVSDETWAANLQSMPPPSVEREIATELALNNYLQFQIYKTSLERGSLEAAHLAVDTQHDYVPTSTLPTPTVTGTSN
ncbi:hypothetical protein [Acidisoma silvae]|uniref:Uncharacterized protein n=1 Tax=Acidisoma silvae TaxID=2802396 RepID=A0A963YUU3_9PROT|nr:hypothetical protein [Acidisoma silvae]MCB8877429.1 hypothetical protein [Acidisoma silvae]